MDANRFRAAAVEWWQPPPRPSSPDMPDADRPDRDRGRVPLALGLVSLLFAPLGVVAWAVASAYLDAIADGRLDPAGESNARAGRVLGIVATCLFVFKVIALIPLLAALGYG